MTRAVPAVTRALDILELFLTGEALSAPDICGRSGLPRTTVHELLHTLLDRDFLATAPERPNHYRLGVRVFQLGGVFAGQLDLARDGQPIAAAVAARCAETVHLAVLDGVEEGLRRTHRKHPASPDGLVGRPPAAGALHGGRQGIAGRVGTGGAGFTLSPPETDRHDPAKHHHFGCVEEGNSPDPRSRAGHRILRVERSGRVRGRAGARSSGRNRGRDEHFGADHPLECRPDQQNSPRSYATAPANCPAGSALRSKELETAEHLDDQR
nr:helix-turn-helix domain-containing protein [Fodinicola feengrottensis]